MNCSVPGCNHQPGEEPEQVKASRTESLSHLPQRKLPDEDEEPVPPGVALTHLCATHRAEFEKLGWLAPAEDDYQGVSNPLAYLRGQVRG